MTIKASILQEVEAGGRAYEIQVHPGQMLYNGGTWTDDVATAVPSKSHSAANEAVTIIVPLPIPAHASMGGGKITAIDLYYSIATADAEAAAAPVVKKVTAGNGTAAAATDAGGTLTFSLTTTASISTGQRKMTITPGTPAYVRTGEFWSAQMTITCATTTVLKVHGAIVKYNRAL